jgi:hypothetical protein
MSLLPELFEHCHGIATSAQETNAEMSEIVFQFGEAFIGKTEVAGIEIIGSYHRIFIDPQSQDWTTRCSSCEGCVVFHT